jgi:formate hydrogenlyase subunit 6/NADH:ubiquinone oxidoreductase subunit I
MRENNSQTNETPAVRSPVSEQRTRPTKSVHISLLPSCIDCGLCALACPTECLGFKQDEKLLFVQSEANCIVCLNCEDICPEDAIRIGLDHYLPNARPVTAAAANLTDKAAPFVSQGGNQ